MLSKNMLSKTFVPDVVTSLCFGDGEGDGGDGGGTDTSGVGDTSAGTTAGSDGGDTGTSTSTFSFDTWDGKRDSLPPEQQSAFDAFSKTQESRQGEAVRRQLLKNLEERYRQQDAGSRPASQDDGKADEQLTRAQFNELIKSREAEANRRARLDAFRNGMKEVVGGVNQFGDATVAFNDPTEVTDFENWIGEMFNGKLTPKDLLFLYRRDQILKANGEAAVRKFEKSLKDRKDGVTTGGRTEQTGQKRKQDDGNLGGDVRGLSLEEFIKKENPGLHRDILAGKLSPLDHV